MSNQAERAELHKTIWKIANDLRGSVDTQQNISLHLQGICGDKELDDDERTNKYFLWVRLEAQLS